MIIFPSSYFPVCCFLPYLLFFSLWLLYYILMSNYHISKLSENSPNPESQFYQITVINIILGEHLMSNMTEGQFYNVFLWMNPCWCCRRVFFLTILLWSSSLTHAAATPVLPSVVWFVHKNLSLFCNNKYQIPNSLIYLGGVNVDNT